MTIETKVVGVRLWPRAVAHREVTLEWQDASTEEIPFPMTHNFQFNDDDNLFELGDVVQIILRKTGSARGPLSIQ